MFNHNNAKATFIQSSRKQNLWKPSKLSHVGVYWIPLAEYSQMSTYLSGFQSFSRFLPHFVLAKFATSSILIIETNLSEEETNLLLRLHDWSLHEYLLEDSDFLIQKTTFFLWPLLTWFLRELCFFSLNPPWRNIQFALTTFLLTPLLTVEIFTHEKNIYQLLVTTYQLIPLLTNSVKDLCSCT